MTFRVGDFLDSSSATFGFEDCALFGTFSAGDSCGAVAICLKYQGATLAFGFHLAVHGLSNISRRLNALEFHTHNANAPFVSCFIEDVAQRDVDLLAASERLIQLHLTNNVTQIGLCQFGCSHVEVGDVVKQFKGIGGLVVDYGIYRNGDVVLGDDLLWRNIHDVLTHIDLCHSVDKGNEQMKTGLPSAQVFTQPLNHTLLVWADDPYCPDGIDQNHHDDDDTQKHYSVRHDIFELHCQPPSWSFDLFCGVRCLLTTFTVLLKTVVSLKIDSPTVLNTARSHLALLLVTR